MRTAMVWWSLLLWASVAAGTETVRYAGSSTIGKFIADARPVYGDAVIEISTRSVSAGGEQCAIAGTCDIGGVARAVDPDVLEHGVVATLIGRDAIAVVVHAGNPLRAIDRGPFGRIFPSRMPGISSLDRKNW